VKIRFTSDIITHGSKATMDEQSGAIDVLFEASARVPSDVTSE
jgi:hypothetical protein